MACDTVTQLVARLSSHIAAREEQRRDEARSKEQGAGRFVGFYVRGGAGYRRMESAAFFWGGGGDRRRPAAPPAALALQSPPHSPTVDPLSRCMLPFKARAGARWMLSRRFLGNKSCHPRPRGPTPMSFFSRAVDRSSEKDFFRSAASTRPPPFPLTLSFPSSSSTNQLLNRLSASAASLRASSSPRTRPSSASSSATSSTPRPSATCR